MAKMQRDAIHLAERDFRPWFDAHLGLLSRYVLFACHVYPGPPTCAEQRVHCTLEHCPGADDRFGVRAMTFVEPSDCVTVGTDESMVDIPGREDTIVPVRFQIILPDRTTAYEFNATLRIPFLTGDALQALAAPAVSREQALQQLQRGFAAGDLRHGTAAALIVEYMLRDLDVASEMHARIVKAIEMARDAATRITGKRETGPDMSETLAMLAWGAVCCEAGPKRRRRKTFTVGRRGKN